MPTRAPISSSTVRRQLLIVLHRLHDVAMLTAGRVCHRCGSQFTRRANCLRHQASCQDFTHQCSYCGLLMRHRSGLLQHERSQHGQQPAVDLEEICLSDDEEKKEEEEEEDLTKL